MVDVIPMWIWWKCKFTFIFHLISWAPQNQLMLSTFVGGSFIQIFVDMNTQSFNISLRCWNGITDTGRFSNNKIIVWKRHEATWSCALKVKLDGRDWIDGMHMLTEPRNPRQCMPSLSLCSIQTISYTYTFDTQKVFVQRLFYWIKTKYDLFWIYQFTI